MGPHVSRRPRTQPRCHLAIEVATKEADEARHHPWIAPCFENHREPPAGLQANAGELPDRFRHYPSPRDEPTISERCLIEQEGEVLAAENLDGIEIAAGRDDVARNHEFWILEEVEAPWVGLGKRCNE